MGLRMAVIVMKDPKPKRHPSLYRNEKQAVHRTKNGRGRVGLALRPR